MSQNFRTTKKVVDIDLIIPNVWNPNVQSQSMFEKGKQSMEQLGMLGSILVREVGGCYEILDGEHRWKYGKELGYKEMTVETMGEISDSEAKLLTVLMNNIKGSDDIEKRAKIFEQLEQGQLSLLPFTEQEIENEKKLFNFDFSQYDKVEDIEIKKDTIIQIIAPNDVKELWLKCVKIAEEDNKNEIQLFVWLLQYYVDINGGLEQI